MQLSLRAVFAIIGLSMVVLLQWGSDGFTKNTVDVYGNPHFSKKAGIIFFKEIPFTGVAVERFPNKKVARSIEYVQGIQHGVTKEYGFTGAIKHHWNYVNGLKHGLQQTWYLEGPKKTTQNFESGLLHGESTEWFISGQLFRKRTFDKGREVAHKVHFSTGELHTNYVKRDGATYGLKTGELCMDFKDDGEL